jgi:hypothetical protein
MQARPPLSCDLDFRLRVRFHWLGEHSADGGATWRLQVEVFARRVAASSQAV